jgi:hypothetical protein
MAKELAALVDAGTIRVLDLVVLEKDASGSIEGYELEDLGDLGELGMLEESVADILALEDLEHRAAAMEPGSTAGILRLGELVGGPVRRGRPEVGWPTHRQRPHPHPSPDRRVRCRRGLDRRSMTCRLDLHELPAAVSSARR